MSSPSEQNPVITSETVKPAVHYFFSNLSPEQWIRLATGTADQRITCVLAELLGDIMELFLASVLEKVPREEFTPELVEDVVGNVVPEAFAQAIEIKEEVRSKGTENLNRLIVKHLMERVKSNLQSDDEDPGDNYIHRIDGIHRTNAVVQEATVVIQELISWLCKPLLEIKQVAIINPRLVNKDEVNSGDAKTSASQKTCSVEGAQTEELTDKDIKNQNKTAPSSTKPKPKVKGLKRKLKMFFTKYSHKRRSEVAPANLLEEERFSPVDPEVTPQEKRPPVVEDANQVSEITSVQAEDRPAEVNRVENVQPLSGFYETTPVEEFVPEDEASKVTSVRECKAEDRPAEVSQVDDVQPEPKIHETTPVEEFVPEDEASKVTSVRECKAEDRPAEVSQVDDVQPEPKIHETTPVEEFIPEDEASKATSALVVEDVESEEETLDLSQPEVCPAVAKTVVSQVGSPSDEESQEQASDSKEEEGRASVSMLVHGLVAQAAETSNIRCSPVELQATHGRLFGKIWNQLQKEEIHADPARILNHSRKIYASICKALGCPCEIVGALLLLENATFDEAVVSAFLEHLTRSVKKPFLTQFFSAVGKAVSKPFRQTETKCLRSIHPEASSSGNRAAEDEASSDSKQDSGSPPAPGIPEDTTTPTADSNQEETQQVTDEAEDRKVAVKTLISDLIWQIVEKSGQSYPKEQYHAICERLFLQLWPQITDSLHGLSPETIRSLDRAIFSDLCKRWDQPENLLIHLDLGRPLIDKTVLSSFKNHLLNPSKTFGGIRNLFQNIQEAFQHCPTRIYILL